MTSKTFGPGIYHRWTGTGGGTLEIQAGAVFQHGANTAIDLEDGPWIVKVDGEVHGPTSLRLPPHTPPGNTYAAIELGPSTSTQKSKITIGESGVVKNEWTHKTYDDGYGIYSMQAADIINSGHISGGPSFGSGIELNLSDSASGTVNIINKSLGVIDANSEGILDAGISVYGPDGLTVNINNAGIITGEGNAIYCSTFAAIIKNTGTISGRIDLYSGDDILRNSGQITGDIDTGYGNDSLVNAGTIDGSIDLSYGNDRFVNTGSVEGDISLGGGNDIFIGGNSVEKVYDGPGKDSYRLGHGNDEYYWELARGRNQGDIVDGGTGYDWFHADIGFASRGAQINLGTEDAAFAGVAIVAGTASGFNHKGLVKTDAISNFEAVSGTKVGDDLAGGSGRNELDGESGNDQLYGGGGADLLYGGSGDDTFWYTNLTDSTVNAVGRDLIADFEGAGITGGDKINLSMIDANASMDGDQAFDFLGDAHFSKVAGQANYSFQDGNTIISGDVNGDGKADFSIAVKGTLSFVAGDFQL